MNTHTTLQDQHPADQIETVRAFNRFYTNQLGLLGRAFLDSRFTLTEARIIYELAARPGLQAKTLIDELHLDPAYLSRILKKFRGDGLLSTRPDPQDQRSQLLELTADGLSHARTLASRSRQDIAAMLGPLSKPQQETVAMAMGRIESLLSARADKDFILRPHQPGDISLVLGRQTKLYVEEYGWNSDYEALAMQIAADFIRNFKPGREFCWIAEAGGEIAGSVFLVDAGGTAKLRLLYVEPFARGLGIGRALVRECIAFARSAGYEILTLWTNDVLASARRIYETEGFTLVSEERHHSFGKDLNGQNWQMGL
ncbi:helix-turn-helix domain-containing GNAT family N-acetyltransferase [Pararhizobium sp. BT-229]|uniref:bifunctional helix-turn-helix transcriptional regulator/GNAT family N-acetyltransferase n=1 Tax=Pararhizobium sp. BT-229 TaxID=2986923 RepID=UPI0021F75807|nr:helix-turn-helix domain-containing GNAT family N-acetyltransferase [Pararhizobium sp. BT-229]MCV9960938.1 helix-turn-helix domain-containing GNAT family N-acetyltransferase [Pararhizobium sp. BT-229]